VSGPGVWLGAVTGSSVTPDCVRPKSAIVCQVTRGLSNFPCSARPRLKRNRRSPRIPRPPRASAFLGCCRWPKQLGDPSRELVRLCAPLLGVKRILRRGDVELVHVGAGFDGIQHELEKRVSIVVRYLVVRRLRLLRELPIVRYDPFGFPIVVQLYVSGLSSSGLRRPLNFVYLVSRLAIASACSGPNCRAAQRRV